MIGKMIAQAAAPSAPTPYPMAIVSTKLYMVVTSAEKKEGSKNFRYSLPIFSFNKSIENSLLYLTSIS